MPDFRLPYFYHLAAAAIIGFFLANRLEALFRYPQQDPTFWIIAFLTLLPAGTAGFYFVKGYQEQRDLSVREGLFILVVVQVLTALIPAFLR